MQRAFSLLALGITLALTAAQGPISFAYIKAADVAKANKDRWSIKGYLDDPEGEIIASFTEFGLSTGIGIPEGDSADLVTYDPTDCKSLNNDKGLVCKTTGTRLSFKRTKRVPKGAVIEAQKNHNKSSSASSYYTFSGNFRRREFNSSLGTPLSSGFATNGGAIEGINTKCTEKVGKYTSKYLCKPGTVPTPAPTPASSD